MALPILDGNQTSTTLSTIFVSNAHIPAHTVVSFGSQGITDITTAVSGITVTLGQVTITGGLTNTQLRASAVTISGGVYISDAQVTLGNNAPPEAIQIGGYNTSDNKLYPIAVDSNGIQSISGTITANAFGQDYQGAKIQIPVETDSNGISDKFIPIGYSSDGDARQVSIAYPLPSQVCGYDSSGNNQKIKTAAIGSEDLVSGYRLAVGLANNIGYEFGASQNNPFVIGGYSSSLSANKAISVTTLGYQVVTISNTSLAVAGSVTASLSAGTAQIGSVTASISGTPSVTFGAITGSVNILGTSSVTFTQIATHGVTIANSSVTIGGSVALLAGTSQIGSVTASISGTPSVTFTAITGSTSIIGTPSVTFTAITGSTSIIGTPAVTFTAIALPSGTLTTRFGSVTTANTAQISTAVTNTSRKYLLVQNNQTGTSAGAATIGIGFTPTTTQGIQLIAGASYVADSFVPTGAVYWLGSVTGAVFTIVEG